MAQTMQYRINRINQVVSMFVGTNEFETETLGQAIGNRSFDDLYNMVRDLDNAGRSDTWRKALAQWRNTITKAVDVFRDEMEWDFTDSRPWSVTPDQFTEVTAAVHHRLMVWATLQGSIYAGYGI